jgi:hypothetical protein
VYDLEVSIKGKSSSFAKRAIEDADHVQALAESYLALWGIPFPDRLTRTGPRFADELATTGEYHHDGSDCKIDVTRSA